LFDLKNEWQTVLKVKTRDSRLAVGEYYTMAFLKIGLKGAMAEIATLAATRVGNVTGQGY
jgi:hypothetical protein